MENIEKFWTCSMQNCNYNFNIECDGNSAIHSSYYNKSALHFVLHHGDLYMGSIDLVPWWLNNISKNTLTKWDRIIRRNDIAVWRRSISDSLHHYLDKKLGYIEIDKNIDESELELHNRDLKNKNSRRKYIKTEKFYNEYKNFIIGDLKIGSLEILEKDIIGNYRNIIKKNKKQKVKKPQNVSFSEKYDFVRKKGYCLDYNKLISKLTFMEKYDIMSKYKLLKK